MSRFVSDQFREDVKVLLDALHSSLDWGSGFLDAEEIEAWCRVAESYGIGTEEQRVEAVRLRRQQVIDEEHRLAVAEQARIDRQYALRGHPRYQIRDIASGETLVEVTVPRSAGFAWTHQFVVRPEGWLQWWVNDGGETEFVPKGEPFLAGQLR